MVVARQTYSQKFSFITFFSIQSSRFLFCRDDFLRLSCMKIMKQDNGFMRYDYLVVNYCSFSFFHSLLFSFFFSFSFFLFLDAFSHLYKRVCLSVRPSVGSSVRWSVSHTRVELLRNRISGLNSNKIASRSWNYAIRKTIQRQVLKQIAWTHLMSELCQTCFSFSFSFSFFLFFLSFFSFFISFFIYFSFFLASDGQTDWQTHILISDFIFRCVLASL